MKKLLLSLGAVAAVVAPVASVIACGSDDSKDTNTNPGTTDSTNTDGGSTGGVSKDHNFLNLKLASALSPSEFAAVVAIITDGDNAVEIGKKLKTTDKFAIKASGFAFAFDRAASTLTSEGDDLEGGHSKCVYTVTTAAEKVPTVEEAKLVGVKYNDEGTEHSRTQYVVTSLNDWVYVQDTVAADGQHAYLVPSSTVKFGTDNVITEELVINGHTMTYATYELPTGILMMQVNAKDGMASGTAAQVFGIAKTPDAFKAYMDGKISNDKAAVTAKDKAITDLYNEITKA